MREKLLFRSNNIDEAAQRCANELVTEIASLAESQEQVVIALCGGSSPTPLYSALADSIGTLHETTRSKLRFIPLDERCVDDSNPDHNLAQIDHQFFEPLAHSGAIVSWQICWYQQQDSDNEEALARFQESFNGLGSRIDIVIAGVGNDGHIASLFPTHPLTKDRETLSYLLINDSPKPPSQRITASRALISQAKVTIAIFLKGKEEAYGVFNTTSSTIENDSPAKLLNSYVEHPETGRGTQPKLYVLTDIPE